jgi:hypothetical protein
MFSSYVAARTDRERSEIHSRIVDLFARLGVASEYPVIRRYTYFFIRVRINVLKCRSKMESPLYKRLCDQWECEADDAIAELEKQQGRAFTEQQTAVFRKRGEHRFKIPDGSRWGDEQTK